MKNRNHSKWVIGVGFVEEQDQMKNHSEEGKKNNRKTDRYDNVALASVDDYFSPINNHQRLPCQVFVS